MKRAILFTFIVSIVFGFQSKAQEALETEVIPLSLIHTSVGFYTPGADLAVNYGANAGIGISFEQKFSNNLSLIVEANYFFGSDVKNDSLLRNLATNSSDNQFVINQQGTLSDLVLSERGYSFNLKVAKLFPVIGPNPNSGLKVSLGAGFMEHKTRIEGDERDLSYLDEEMKKGYDQLRNGFSTNQFIGYQHLSNNRRVNYFIGLDFTQAFTENRRGYSYASQTATEGKKLDLLYGIKLGWTLPLYQKIRTTYYY